MPLADSRLLLGFLLAHEPIIGIDIWEHVRKTIIWSRSIVLITSVIPSGLLPTVQERQAGCEMPCPPYTVHPVADLGLAVPQCNLECYQLQGSGAAISRGQALIQLKIVNTVEPRKQICIESKKYKDRMNGENAQRCAP